MAVEFQDYYQVLKVSKTATQQEIQKAYRKLARTYHPDINKEKGAEDKFKKITEAYEVLKNPEARKRYDMLGSNYHSGQPFTPPGGQGWQNVNVDFGDLGGSGASGFSSFFEQFFGGGFKQQRRRPQETTRQDQEAIIEISLEEAMQGTEKEFLIQDSPQPNAAGRQLRVKIPPGATQDARIRLKGHGTEKSDLVLIIKLRPHPLFRAQKRDLFMNLALSPWEAALGTTIKITTLDNSIISMKVPPGTQSGSQLRLRAKGLPAKSGQAGDLFVEMLVVIPTKLTTEEKTLFEKLKEISLFNPRK
jgi:curved DNA-binding protein